jgi:hypothetical protein
MKITYLPHARRRRARPEDLREAISSLEPQERDILNLVISPSSPVGLVRSLRPPCGPLCL